MKLTDLQICSNGIKISTTRFSRMSGTPIYFNKGTHVETKICIQKHFKSDITKTQPSSAHWHLVPFPWLSSVVPQQYHLIYIHCMIFHTYFLWEYDHVMPSSSYPGFNDGKFFKQCDGNRPFFYDKSTMLWWWFVFLRQCNVKNFGYPFTKISNMIF